MCRLEQFNATVSRGESATTFNSIVSFTLNNFLSSHCFQEHKDTCPCTISPRRFFPLKFMSSINDDGRTAFGWFTLVGENMRDADGSIVASTARSSQTKKSNKKEDHYV